MVKYWSIRRNDETLLGELTIGVPVHIQRLSALRLANAIVTFFHFINSCSRLTEELTLSLGILQLMTFIGHHPLPFDRSQRS